MRILKTMVAKDCTVYMVIINMYLCIVHLKLISKLPSLDRKSHR